MKNIHISKQFYQELKSNIDTNLIFSDIEILEYTKKDNQEYLKIELPFTTTGNILTYSYNKETNELLLIDKTIYIMNTNSEKDPYIDKETILKLFTYSRSYFYKTITSDQRISKIFEIIAKGLKLDNENLNLYLIDNKDIQELIDESILIPNESNQYSISLTRSLYHYGVKLLLNNKKSKANRCFEKCSEYDPNNKDYYYYSLLAHIKNKNYQDALKMIIRSKELSIEIDEIDKILYIYLLNILTNCTIYFEDILDNFDPDILIESLKQEYLDNLEYQIKKDIIINKFKHAFKLINIKIKDATIQSIKEDVLRELLSHVVNKEELYKYNLSISVKTENYNETISLIESKLKQRYLNSNEKYIYLLTKTLIKITTSKIIPIPTTAYATNVYDAIIGNNFVLAQSLNEEYLENKNKSKEDDLVNILLTKINNLILEIKLDTETYLDLPFEYDEHKTSLSNQSTFDILEPKTIIEPSKQDSSTKDKSLSFAQDLAYYLKENNLTIEEGHKKIGITSEQLLLVKLIYARDYYIESMYQEGDKLLKEVEKSKDKTKIVKYFLNEIRANKKFYKNRLELKNKKRTIIIKKF